MNIELINTGSELMLGRVLNTHQRWLCRRLADAGLVVNRQVAVPDTGPAIQEAVAEGLSRASLVITTGGLGPTSDDITRDLVAQLLGLRLIEDGTARRNIEQFFSVRGRRMPPSVLVQALVPEGATVLQNAHGTAPGLAMEVPAGGLAPEGALLVMLPGPPRELHPMFDDQVLPLLRRRFRGTAPFHCVTLRTTGMGESWVEEKLMPHLPPWLERGLEIGYCARTGEVDVRLAARGDGAVELVGEAEEGVRSILGPVVYGTGDDSLEAEVIRQLKGASATLSVAESCTGGFLAHRLTNVPGASEAFWGGWLVYANEAKTSQLGVSVELLTEHGAVSEPVVRAMAEGAVGRAGTRYALAVTGIAGPGGGTPEKPVGTVYLALAQRGGATVVRRCFNPFDRETFKYVTTQQALEMVRRAVLGLPPN